MAVSRASVSHELDRAMCTMAWKALTALVAFLFMERMNI